MRVKAGKQDTEVQNKLAQNAVKRVKEYTHTEERLRQLNTGVAH